MLPLRSLSTAAARLGAAALLLAVPGYAMAAPRHTPFNASQSSGRGTEKAAPSGRFTVAVLGDAYGEALAEGLRLNYANQTEVAVVERTHAPYGLAQDDRFDWTIAARNLFAGQDHIDAAVIMLGANDEVPLGDGTTTVEPRSPRWLELYGNRVEAVAALFRDKGIPLTWVGLPIVQDDALSADYVALNEVIRDRAVKAGASYVDSWQAFADEGGQYAKIGPDVNGRLAKLRTDDGVDFTRAGARKLASFVEPELRQDRERKLPPPNPEAVVLPDQPEFDNALQIDINAQIRREAGLPALPSSDTARSPVGPMVPITAPALSPGGRLAAASTDATEDEPRLVQRALIEGQPIQPRPGRMDDFTWPKP